MIIPTFIAQPITARNAQALAALVKVAGPALNRHIDTILGALVIAMEAPSFGDITQDLDAAIEAVLNAVTDTDGVHQLEMLLLSWSKDPKPQRRITACKLLTTFCQVTTADISDYRTDWIRILINLFDESKEDVVSAAWEAFEALVKTIDKNELQEVVVPLRRSIESIGASDRDVPGFCRPKGAQTIVPILLAGVLSGSQEQKEQGALGIGDLVQRTSEAAIKPYIIQLTGPLIRVITSQSISPQIKSAM